MFAREHYCALLEQKKRDDLLFKKQEGEDQEIRKRELQDLQNKRDKAKRQLASIDKEIVLLTKIKKVTKLFKHFSNFFKQANVSKSVCLSLFFIQQHLFTITVLD